MINGGVLTMSDEELKYYDDEGKEYIYLPAEASITAQRKRLLTALQCSPISTIEAREYLGIMHPAGRVKELRDLGFKIKSVPMVVERDGVRSTIANYHLRPYHDVD